MFSCTYLSIPIISDIKDILKCTGLSVNLRKLKNYLKNRENDAIFPFALRFTVVISITLFLAEIYLFCQQMAPPFTCRIFFSVSSLSFIFIAHFFFTSLISNFILFLQTLHMIFSSATFKITCFTIIPKFY